MLYESGLMEQPEIENSIDPSARSSISFFVNSFALNDNELELLCLIDKAETPSPDLIRLDSDNDCACE